MSMETLIAAVRDQTVVYRKGAEITEREENGLRVVDVFGYPETPSHGELVDCHFVNVGFTEAAADRAGFIAALEAAFGPGEFCVVTRDRMQEGPSYIELGGWVGSQDLALRLLALGEHHGVWHVMTPARIGVVGPEADALAGQGFVMASGYNPVPDPVSQG